MEKVYVGANLHKGQLEIVKEIIKSESMYHTVVTSRQFGKSFLLIQLILYYAINKPGCKIMLTTPIYSQSAKIYKELLNGIRDSGIVKKFNSAENSVILVNKSEIFFKSVQLPDNLRGESVDYLFCDEAAMYKEGVFDSVLRPMLTVRGKKCVLFSTPRGNNWFRNMYNRSNDNVRYKSYHKTWRDNPYANIDEINDAKISLPDAIFRQEYEGEFVNEGGSIFGNLDKYALINSFKDPIPGEKYYAGLDIAITNDFLVFTILNSKGEVVHIYRDNGKTVDFMLNQLKILFDTYNPQYTLVETNGIGMGIYEQIKKLHRSVDSFTTTNKSKSDIIEDLIYSLQTGKVTIPAKDLFSYLYDEMNDFGFKYNHKTRTIRYESMSGHDDCVISLALSGEALKKGISKGRYIIV